MSRPSTAQRSQTPDNPIPPPVPRAPHRQGLKPVWPIPHTQSSPCDGKPHNQRRLAKPESSKDRSKGLSLKLKIRNKESAFKNETIGIDQATASNEAISSVTASKGQAAFEPSTAQQTMQS